MRSCCGIHLSRATRGVNWVSEHLSEAWLFSTAVYVVWHPAPQERTQNVICIAGPMSVAGAPVRLKKLEYELDEVRVTQLLEAGPYRKKPPKKKKLHGDDSRRGRWR